MSKPQLFERKDAKALTFKRDNHRCVVCGAPAVDAHHLIDRSLWEDGGYYLDNLVSLCSECHLKAETTELSPQYLRELAGIKHILLPPQLPSERRYDKWGNLYLDQQTERRVPGELFHQENVQRILSRGQQLEHFERERLKYPRTFHFPWSEALQNDDRRMETLEFLSQEEIVVTEKMDGENTTLTHNGVYARSPDSKSHPSRNWIRRNHGIIAHDLPEHWRFCGENLYAKHSLAYDSLPSYFMLFNIWDDRNYCLSWDETVEWAGMLGMTTVPVIYRGKWDETVLRRLARELSEKSDKVEGYVVRVARSFPYTHFSHLCGKYVRAGHVQTSKFWMNEAVIPNTLAENASQTFQL